MVRDVRDVSYTYKGHVTTLKDVGGEYCPACDESIHGGEEADYLSSAMLAFNREIDGFSVKPSDSEGAAASESRIKRRKDTSK